MTERDYRRRHLRLPIGPLLAVGFGGLMLIAVAGVLLAGLGSAQHNTFELLGEKADAAVQGMVDKIDATLRPVEDQARWIADAVAAGKVDVSDRPSFDRFIIGTLAATPQLVGCAILDPDLRMRRYLRSDGSVLEDHIPNDAEAKEILRNGRIQTGSNWGRPIHVDEIAQTVVNLRTPLRQGERFLGMLIQGVTIAELSLSLAIGRAQEGLIPFVLYDRDKVIVHPLLIQGQTGSQTAALHELADFGDGTLAEIWNPDAYPIEVIKRYSGLNGSAVRIGDREIVFLHRTIERYSDKPLTVGVYLDAETEAAQLLRLRDTAIFGLVVLVIAVAAALWIGRRTSAPIRRLAGAARVVRAGDLDKFEPLGRTGLREMDDASFSFNAMVEGLKERELIRNLFGKYVPESVAEQLVAEQGAIEPHRAESTILFGDIAGFTALTERNDAADVVDMLNAYFAVVAEILESHGGVITQFQGDGLLAMFNVPLEDPDHAAQAVRAADAMRSAVAARTFAGQSLRCRIGITTGEVVAGAVGAAGRLSYTVHGDSVNLAARLEQMNKETGTSILVAETTASRAPSMAFRRIGSVDVRGKSESVTVYTLDG